jgi:hypothetical protein
MLSILDYIGANYPDQFILFEAVLDKSANQSVSLNTAIVQVSPIFEQNKPLR